jgi:hypothetical protein
MRSIPSILMYVCAAFNMLYAVAINMGGNTRGVITSKKLSGRTRHLTNVILELTTSK